MKEKEKKIKNSEDKTTAQASPEKYIKELRRQRRQNIFFAISTLLAICALGLAWFVSNTRVSGTGIQIAAAGSKFYLATLKNDSQGIYDNTTSITLYDDKEAKEYTLTEQIIRFITGSNTVIYDGKEYILADNDNISLMVSAENNIANDKAENNKQIRPGSTGSILFYLIPNEDNLGTVDLLLTIKGYKVTPEQTENGENQANMTEINNDKDIMMLLSGHMMFFQNKNENNKYSGMIVPEDENITEQSIGLHLSVDMSNCKANEPRQIQVYWIWPERFDNLFSQNGEKFIIDTTSTSDCNILETELKEKHSRFILTHIEEGLPVKGNENYESVLEQWNNGYNQGDQKIGTTVSFITVKISEKKKS